jgi:hypothetical protein
MAVVPYISQDQVVTTSHPYYLAEVYAGAVLNLHRAVAHSPRLLEGVVTLNQAMHEMRLDRRLREIAYLRVAQLLQCVM